MKHLVSLKVLLDKLSQTTEVSIFVEERVDAVNVVLSSKTQSDNSKASDSHLPGKDTHFDKCAGQAKVSCESKDQSDGILWNPGESQ